MSQLFELFMVICFGISWPFNIYKGLKSRTAKGRSLAFSLLVWVGYLFGIISKLLAPTLSYVIIAYIINLIMVGIDICIFIRNLRLDRQLDTAAKTAP